MNLPFKPVADRVVVLPASPEEITSGGIHINPNFEKKQRHGTLVSGGNQVTMPTGATVYYFGTGTPRTHEGKEYLIMRQRDLEGHIQTQS